MSREFNTKILLVSTELRATALGSDDDARLQPGGLGKKLAEPHSKVSTGRARSLRRCRAIGHGQRVHDVPGCDLWKLLSISG
jgi:hypothetical protein